MTESGYNPDDFAAFQRILAQAATLPSDDPDSVLVSRAVGHMFKRAKRIRRQEANRQRVSADRAVLGATATGSENRIDDETAGLELTGAPGEFVGSLLRPQHCYICKNKYTEVDAFHHQLCPGCASKNRDRRNQRVDLRGRRGLLTGGRAKIGMYIALMLLRDGVTLTITTRFPKDAARRFASVPDSAEWLNRLTIIGIDLRDPAQVVNLAESVSAAGHLDILINNAAQTVRRSRGAYSALVAAESTPLIGPAATIDLRTLGESGQLHPQQLMAGARAEREVSTSVSAESVAALALTAGSASLARIHEGTAIDAGGLVPDLVATNSWVQTVEQVDPLELLEVQLCNSVAPFILVSRLRPVLAASPHRRSYVVNVSAMEGIFSRGYKGAGHPHTNMAKAALNMLTRTSAQEMFADGILMTAVDTGWITDERPHESKVRLAAAGFRAPLDLIDGAARVYDPIVQGERGIDLYGCFLKDFVPYGW